MRTTDNTLATSAFFTGPVIGLWLMVLMGFGAQGLAQPTTSIQGSLDAYALVDDWVRDWQVPAFERREMESMRVSVAIVTLRLDGRVFGRGEGVSIEPSNYLVWEATKEAIQSANAKLTTERDAMWDEFVAEFSSRITITLEIADSLIPVSPSELELPGFGYTPGVLGIAAGRGERLEVHGPESMLARNTDMTQSAMALANTLAGDGSVVLRSPSELVESGFSFYRFEPIVLAQPGESMGAAFLDRGGRVIGDAQANPANLKVFASQIAKHIASRQWPGVESYGIMGTLDPVAHRCDSNFASPFDQAITAFALLRYSSVPNSTNAKAAKSLGRHLLVELAEIESLETDPWENPISASMTIIALSELELIDILGDESLAKMRTMCLAVLDQSFSPSAGFEQSLPSSSHGLIAYALVRSSEIDAKDRTPSAIAAIDQVFEDTPVQGLVSQMPFLGWAAIEQGANMQADGWMAQLVDMRTVVWEHQLKRDDLTWSDRDLRGGIVFTSSSTPLPSWLGTKPIAVLATMLRDQSMTPGTLVQGQLPLEIGSLIDSLRYIHQLGASLESGHLYASPESSVGGIRRALWDQHMPIEADAMALLAITESIRSFDEILGRSSKD